jgi:hypothetical protein
MRAAAPAGLTATDTLWERQRQPVSGANVPGGGEHRVTFHQRPTTVHRRHLHQRAVRREVRKCGLPISALALYEPPYIVDGLRPRPPADLPVRVWTLVEAGSREAALVSFLREGMDMGDAGIEGVRSSPLWPRWLALTPTTAYDALIGDIAAGLGALAGGGETAGAFGDIIGGLGAFQPAVLTGFAGSLGGTALISSGCSPLVVNAS